LIALADPARPIIVGILNVTPDSFSDGGRHSQEDVAVAHGLRMADEGADIIDIGGESTRPGAERVSAAEQLTRVANVIRRLREQIPAGVGISIDTTLTEVAEAALDLGVELLNDVSAGTESRMLELAARRGVPIVLMHKKGAPRDMQQAPYYDNVVEEVSNYLFTRAAAAERAGLMRTQIVIDPGIGFGKRKGDNLALIGNLKALVAAGYPVMLGASRKSFMTLICGDMEFDQLVGGTCATTALGIAAGVRIFRVHDVLANRQAADVAWEVCRATHGEVEQD
jgi:dihydropteroate synthase